MLDSGDGFLILLSSVSRFFVRLTSTYGVDGLGERVLDSMSSGLTEDLGRRVVSVPWHVARRVVLNEYLMSLRIPFVLVVLHGIEDLRGKISERFAGFHPREMEMHGERSRGQQAKY